MIDGCSILDFFLVQEKAPERDREQTVIWSRDCCAAYFRVINPERVFSHDLMGQLILNAK